MNKFLKGLTISTGCNFVSLLGKIVVGSNMDFSEIRKGLLEAGGWLSLGTSYFTSTVPALVGYGVGSLVDNGFGKQVLSVPTAIALTAGAECFTNGLMTITPTLDNFKLWSERANVNCENLKAVDKIIEQKFEMIDFANTFIQTELFNIFLPDAVDAPEVESGINIDYSNDATEVESGINIDF